MADVLYQSDIVISNLGMPVVVRTSAIRYAYWPVIQGQSITACVQSAAVRMLGLQGGVIHPTSDRYLVFHEDPHLRCPVRSRYTMNGCSQLKVWRDQSFWLRTPQDDHPQVDGSQDTWKTNRSAGPSRP